MTSIPAPVSFEADTSPDPLGAGRYRAQLSRDWWVVAGPNGGTVAAIVLRAMLHELNDSAREPRSLTLHYLRAPVEGEVNVAIRLERSGRSVSFLSARMEQEGRPAVLALAVVATEREGIALADLPAPDVAPPEFLSPREPPEHLPPFAHNFELREAIGAQAFAGAERAVVGGWIALREDRPVDHALLAQLTDAWYPAVFACLNSPAAVPTVDLTVHFRSPLPPPDVRFVLGRWETRHADQGFLEEDGTLWAPDGTLLAQSRQLAVAG